MKNLNNLLHNSQFTHFGFANSSAITVFLAANKHCYLQTQDT